MGRKNIDNNIIIKSALSRGWFCFVENLFDDIIKI